MSDAPGATARGRGWFARHPRTTILACALLFAITADLVCGLLLIEPGAGTFRALHPYYHHGFVPLVSTTTRWGESEYPIHTNSLGFRDRSAREVALDPAAERLLVIGDSFVEGMGLAYAQTFLDGLERGLGPGVEVLNAGAVSYCPTIYRLKVDWLLEHVGLRFDRLLVLIDISDIQDEVHYRSFVPRAPSLAETKGAEARAFLARRSFVYHAVTAFLRRRRGGISTAVDVSTLADNAIYFQGLEAYEGATQASVEEGRWEWTIAKPLLDAWGLEGLRLAEADMSALVAQCKARAIEVVVCVYPSPVQILMRDEDSLQVKFWRRFCKEQALRFVDLFPLFVGEEAGRPRAVYERYFIAGDVHWNAAGHRLVADALLEQL